MLKQSAKNQVHQDQNNKKSTSVVASKDVDDDNNVEGAGVSMEVRLTDWYTQYVRNGVN